MQKVNKFLFVLIITLGIYYVAAMNDLSVRGFKLQELKRETKDLDNSNKELELKIMSLGSYNNLSERVRALGMVSAGRAEYVMEGGGAVAKIYPGK